MSFEEIEQSNTDAQTEVSSEPSSESAQTATKETSQEDQVAKPESDNRPFHEHPRFKELIEQKNAESTARKGLEAQIAELRREQQRFTQERQKSVEAPANPLVDRLKGIDPEFGALMEQLAATPRQLQEFQDWRRNTELSSLRSQFDTQVKSLHSEHKVSDGMQDLYLSQIKDAVASNPELSLADVPRLYKSVHDRMTKVIDDVKRAERESYVKDKKADNSVPTQGKGKAVSASKDTEYSKDPVEARSQMISRVLKQVKASSSI